MSKMRLLVLPLMLILVAAGSAQIIDMGMSINVSAINESVVASAIGAHIDEYGDMDGIYFDDEIFVGKYVVSLIERDNIYAHHNESGQNFTDRMNASLVRLVMFDNKYFDRDASVFRMYRIGLSQKNGYAVMYTKHVFMVYPGMTLGDLHARIDQSMRSSLVAKTLAFQEWV
jgi:hypothetical protein